MSALEAEADREPHVEDVGLVFDIGDSYRMALFVVGDLSIPPIVGQASSEGFFEVIAVGWWDEAPVEIPSDEATADPSDVPV